MALVLKDRVKETTTTTGTGSYVLAGAVTGFQSFTDALANGDTTHYAVENGTDWETGLGTWTESTTTLARTTIYESSNSGNAVDWGAGSKDIFITKPASRDSTITVYATSSDLPTTGLQAGDQAFVSNTARLYISNGVGWYSVAVVNQTPTISGNSASYTLATDGTATTVTLTATDPEGDPITWSATTSGTTAAATVTNSANVFTITPSTNTANGGTLTVTFRASDGINIGTANSDFVLEFLVPQWGSVQTSLATNSTNGLDNTTFVDRSSNSHSPSLTGTPVQSPIHPYLDNYSVEFDGGEKLTTQSTQSAFNLTSGDWTIELWVKDNLTTDAVRTMMNMRTSSGSYGFLFRRHTSNRWELYYNGGTRTYATITDYGNLTDWYHMAIVVDNGTFRWFVNGQQAFNTTTFTQSNYVWDTLDLGSYSSHHWNGYISNVRVVKGTAVYTSNFTPPTEKLTAVTGTTYLGLQSNRFIDTTGNESISVASGTPKVSSANPFGQEDHYTVADNRGSAVFSETSGGEYIDFGQDSSFAFGTGDFTVEWWHYATGNYWGTVFDTSSSAAYAGSIFIGPHGAANYSIAAYLSGGGTIQANTAGENLPLYQWTHCAIVRNGTSIKAYINGVEDGSNTSTHDLTMNDATVGRATYWTSSYDLRGGDKVADLKVTKGTAVYTSSFTPPTSPVGNTNASLYLPMDNSGIFDASSVVEVDLLGSVETDTNEKKFASSSIYIPSGSANRIEFVHPPVGGDSTYECWFNADSLVEGSYGVIFSIEGHLKVTTMSTGALRLFHSSSSLGDSSTGLVSTGTWYHLALVRSKTDSYLKVYLDGSQVISNTTYTGSLNTNPTGNDAYLGYFGDGFGHNYQGNIENFQISDGVKYSTAFTAPTTTQSSSYQKDS